MFGLKLVREVFKSLRKGWLLHLLKERLVTAPVLTIPNGQSKFTIFSDASETSIGCVLMQEGKVVAYA